MGKVIGDFHVAARIENMKRGIETDSDKEREREERVENRENIVTHSWFSDNRWLPPLRSRLDST